MHTRENLAPPEPSSLRPPELLAPAGDRRCAEAAVAAGADAVYFGLATKTNFNARTRATNVSLRELDALVAWLHRHGVKGYVTLNTLVFSRELEEAEAVLRHVAASGADAVLVQDLGLARLARAVCPSLPIHASTQMSLTSAEGIRTVESLGIERVILARELSLEDIRRIAGQTRLTLEVFVHGALCISYSGQCLASRTLGRRSANRGDCAQPCRLAYRLVCDETVGSALRGVPEAASGASMAVPGTPRRALPTDPPMYLLSPLDLAAYALVPELIRAGVGALKIEGRLKSPEYVAVVTRHYRRAIDAAMAGRDPHFSQDEVRQLEAAFSRGFSHGWLEGDQPKKLVSGLSSAKRGTLLGKVTRVLGRRIEIALSSAVQRGDGVLFAGDGAEGEEQGGRVYQVYVDGRPAPGPVSSGLVELAPARGSMAWSKVRAGQTVWKTHDPELYRDLRRAVGQARRDRKTPLDLVVEAEAGQRLRIYGRTAAGARCQVESAEPLAEAVRHPLSEAMLAEQLGRLGATPYQLRGLEARIVGRPLAPLSVLGRLRREIIAQLDAASASPSREIAAEPQVARLRAALRGPDGGRDAPGTETPRLHVLCRSPEQLRAALDYGVRSLIAEYRDIADYRDAVRTARHGGAEISLATPRIQRPGETWVFQAIAAHGPDGVLVRNLAALDFFRDRGLPATADFSLNAANELTAEWLYERGACRVTPCHDVSRDRLKELVAAAPPGRLEVVVHLHVPMFHTQHCLFCAHLSAGNNRAECRRPCQHHVVRLEDRKGVQHLVAPDTLCRNTVYHAVPQSAAEIVLWLVARGVRHFRVELLDERGKRQVRRILEVYDELLAGHVPGREAWARLRALSPSGVTRGTLL